MRPQILMVALALSACSGDPTITLFFPNEVSQAATQKISIQVFDRSSGSGAIGLSCAELLGQAGSENPTAPPPTEEVSFGYPLSGEERIPEINKGKPIVYVLGHKDDDAPPILEGCSDTFDTSDGNTEIDLEVVIPMGSTIVKSLGDLQSGLAGEELSVPIRVQVLTPGGGETPPIPGVELLFQPSGGFQIINANDGPNSTLLSDDLGFAEVRVRAPTNVADGTIVVSSPSRDELAPVTFTLGVVGAVNLSPTSSGFSFGARPVALASGRISSGGIDLAVLSCSGNEGDCMPSASNTQPGESVLHIVENLGGNLNFRTGPAGLGIVPTGIALFQPSDQPQIAISNGWRQDCRNRICQPNQPCGCFRANPGTQRPCPCEGAEVVTVEPSGGSFMVERHAMTGSSAVGLAALRINGVESVAIAAAGRSLHERPCNPNNTCAAYDIALCEQDPGACGCPPSEQCAPNVPGGPLCVAIDQKLDVLTAIGASSSLVNLRGCQLPDLLCDRTDQMDPTTACDCIDSERGNICSVIERCGCEVPQASFIGDPSLTFKPLAVAAGDFGNPSNHGIVVGTPTSLQYMSFQVNSEIFMASKALVLNIPQEGVATTQFDTQIDNALDVVSYSRAPCGTGQLEGNCELVQERPTLERGCLTTHLSAGSGSLLVDTPDLPDICRRLPLDYTPTGICAGRLNDDAFDDIAVATESLGGDGPPGLVLYAGDGNGGLLLPPTQAPLDVGGAGPIECVDVNGDGLAEVVMVDGENVHIFSAR